MSSELEKLQKQIAVLQRKLSREQFARIAAEDMLNNYSRDAYLANQNLRRALSDIRTAYQYVLEQLPDEQVAKLSEKIKIPSSDLIDRMTLLSQLAAGIAHEINNPIGYIKSNCQIEAQIYKDLFAAWEALRQRLQQEDETLNQHMQSVERQYMLFEVKEMLEDLQGSNLEGVGRITDVVDSLQVFSSPAITEKEWVNIDELLQIALDPIMSKLPDKLHFDLKLTVSDEDLLVNIGQIKKVIQLIVENAVDACNEGDTITVTTVIMPGNCKIVIRDTGEGIKPENLPLIFTPFFTTKAPGAGTGMGLCVAQALCEAHNGWLDIESLFGEGTTVTLNLPLGSV